MKKPLLILGIVVSLAAGTAMAIPAPPSGQEFRSDVPPPPIGVGVSGELRDENTFVLAVRPGRISSRAVLIHCEPSHTLMMAVVDSTFARTPKGQALVEQIQSENPRAFMETDLPEGQPRAILEAPDRTDERVTVTIYGAMMNGEPLDGFLLADARVNLDSFGFTSSVSGDSVVVGDDFKR